MLNQTRIGVGNIKFHRRRPMRVNICLPYVKIQIFVYFSIFSYYFGQLSLSFSSYDYTYYLGRHADSNQNSGG